MQRQGKAQNAQRLALPILQRQKSHHSKKSRSKKITLLQADTHAADRSKELQKERLGFSC